MLIPLQYVTWAELIYIQLLTPNASFLGHLAGILAGMLHVTVFQRLPMLRPGTRPFSGAGQYAQDTEPTAVSMITQRCCAHVSSGAQVSGFMNTFAKQVMVSKCISYSSFPYFLLFF